MPVNAAIFKSVNGLNSDCVGQKPGVEAVVNGPQYRAKQMVSLSTPLFV